MEILDRIKIAVKTLISLGVAKNQEDIGLMLGYTSKSAFSQVLNGKVSLPNDFIDRLCKLDKRLVKMWIVNEVGSVLRSQEQSKQVYIDNNIVVENIKPARSLGLPRVSVEAVGGVGNNAFSFSEQDIREYISVPSFTRRKADFIIGVSGSSMRPKYSNGDLLACRIINERSFIEWNKPHVIATTDRGLIVKRIKKGSTEDTLTMVSEDSEYEPFEIPKEEITGIAIVVGVIRLE